MLSLGETCMPPSLATAELVLCMTALCCSLHQPGPDVLKEFGRSVHEYMGLSSWPIFASNRDPALTEYLSTKQASNTAAYVTIHSGALTVSYRRTSFAMQRSTLSDYLQSATWPKAGVSAA